MDVEERKSLPCSAHVGDQPSLQEFATNDEVLPDGSDTSDAPIRQFATPEEDGPDIEAILSRAVGHATGLDVSGQNPTTEDSAGDVSGANLTDEDVRQIMEIVPGLSEEDVRQLEADEVQLFMDLQEMNKAMREVASDLQKSGAEGGPTSIVGFFRMYMTLTKTGVGELSALTKIQRLRMQSIIDETVDMTPGEMGMIKEILLPRFFRWKALQDRPDRKARNEAREKKRAAKKSKKMRVYDPITGLPR